MQRSNQYPRYEPYDEVKDAFQGTTKKILTLRQAEIQVEEKLAAKVDEYQSLMVYFSKEEERQKERWKEYASISRKFENLIKDHSAKKRRAQERGKRERETTQKLLGDIQKATKEVGGLHIREQNMSLHAEKLEQYRAYLEEVFRCSEEFMSMKDILTRFDALIETQSDLLLLKSALETQMNTLMAKYNTFKDERLAKLLSLRNEMVKLKETYDHMVNRKYERLQNRDAEYNTVVERRVNADQVQTSLDNLLQRCMHPSSILHSAFSKRKVSNDEKLSALGQYFVDIQSIVDNRPEPAPVAQQQRRTKQPLRRKPSVPEAVYLKGVDLTHSSFADDSVSVSMASTSSRPATRSTLWSRGTRRSDRDDEPAVDTNANVSGDRIGFHRHDFRSKAKLFPSEQAGRNHGQHAESRATGVRTTTSAADAMRN